MYELINAETTEILLTTTSGDEKVSITFLLISNSTFFLQYLLFILTLPEAPDLDSMNDDLYCLWKVMMLSCIFQRRRLIISSVV